MPCWAFYGESDVSCMYPLFLDEHRQEIPICAKMIFSWARKDLGIVKAHMPQYSRGLQCQQLFQLVFSRCSSCRQVTGPEFYPARHYFSTYITTMVLALGFCSLHCYGPQWVVTLFVSFKHWLVLSVMGVLGCLAIALPSTEQIIFPIVCVVLVPQSWNYCFGEEGPTTQDLPLIVCLMASLNQRKYTLRQGMQHKVAAPYLTFYYIHCIKEIVESCR